MASSPLPVNLRDITEREATIDAVYRAVLAFDHSDETLLRSAMMDDTVTEMPGVISIKGILELKAAVFDRVSKLDTTHFISNMRVNIESATIAQVSR